MKRIILFLAVIFSCAPAWAEIVTRTVEYQHGDTVLEGYLAYDEDVPGKRPGILVVHEWKGLGDYAKKRAEQLAALGYIAFAADMYGKGVYARDHAEAGKLAGMYTGDRQLMRERALAGLEILKAEAVTDTRRLAAVGYCFGGATVLEMARAGFPLKGVVSFHGMLKTPLPAAPGAVKAAVMVMNGADDTYITPEDIKAFAEEMRAAGADWQFVSFGGAVHSFTVKEAGNDPSKGAAYNAAADRRSWQMMREFFQEIFV